MTPEEKQILIDNLTQGDTTRGGRAYKVDATINPTGSGLATSAKQDTGNTSLATVATQTTTAATALGTLTNRAVATSNGLSAFRNLALNSTAVAIKASSGNIYGWSIINQTATIQYIKIYNIAAASVNPASSVPVRTVQLPASGSIFQEPACILKSFDTAISIRVVSDVADTGTSAPATSPIVEIDYL